MSILIMPVGKRGRQGDHLKLIRAGIEHLKLIKPGNEHLKLITPGKMNVSTGSKRSIQHKNDIGYLHS